MIEIERKYILKDRPREDFKKTEIGGLAQTIHISQFYTENGWRYRSERICGEDSYHRIKKTAVDVVNGMSVETEPEVVSKEEFNKLLALAETYISKTRYVYESGESGIKFHVDVFKNIKLVMLEVELPLMNYPFTLPSNIQEQIITEVTGNKNFSNRRLQPAHPY